MRCELGLGVPYAGNQFRGKAGGLYDQQQNKNVSVLFGDATPDAWLGLAASWP